MNSDQELVVVGFAAETHDTLNHAREKRQRKGLHAIVVNDVSDARIGFNSPDNATTFISDKEEVTLPRQSKASDSQQFATTNRQQFRLRSHWLKSR